MAMEAMVAMEAMEAMEEAIAMVMDCMEVDMVAAMAEESMV